MGLLLHLIARSASCGLVIGFAHLQKHGACQPRPDRASIGLTGGFSWLRDQRTPRKPETSAFVFAETSDPALNLQFRGRALAPVRLLTLKFKIIISVSRATLTGRGESHAKEGIEMGCHRELLAEGEGYGIVGCSCGAYYLQIGEVSLRLSNERFQSLAREMSRVGAGREAGAERTRPALEVLPFPLPARIN